MGNNKDFNSKNQSKEEFYAKTQNKKGQNKGINIPNKLVFIWECCKYKKDYKIQVNITFWLIIWKFL